ncbi:hypothetical protein D3C79_799660 [compost metagenome]
MRLPPGQQAGQDAAAVERRQREQVEGPHHQVDQDAGAGHFDEEALLHAAGHQHHEQHGPGNGLDEIGRGAGQRDPDHVAFGVAQVVEAHRHGLGIAEQESARRREVQHQRHQYGADGVDVLDRVERDAPQHIGRVVAEVARGIAVGGFVHRDGEQHGQGVDEDGLEEFWEVHMLIVSDQRLWRAAGRASGGRAAGLLGCPGALFA